MARVNFRQGLITYGQTSGGTQVFLSLSGSRVSFNASAGPTTMTFAHGPTTNYYFVEGSSISSAWAGPFSNVGSYWLYWELDIRTGERTFGHTELPPVAQATAPRTPATGQMWFNTSSNVQMWYEWSGTRWLEKIRVLAAELRNGQFYSTSINAPAFAGTQVGLTASCSAGSITFDDAGKPIKNGTGKFFTTEDMFVAGVPSGSHLKISPVILEAVAQSNIDAYSFVQFTDFGKIVAASPTSQDIVAYGLIEEDVVIGQRVLVTMEGVVSSNNWNFTNAGVNSLVYVDGSGSATTTRAIPSQVPIGIVVDTNTILLRASRILAVPIDNLSHSGLLDLNLDDHPQYLTEERGDARYYIQPTVNQFLATKSDVGHSHIHATLTGLDADDHPQYHDDIRGDARYYLQSQVDTLLAGKANIVHAHTIADTVGLQTALDGKSDVTHTHIHANLTGLGADDHPQYFNALRGDIRYALVGHGHAIADVTGLQPALDGKSNVGHGHIISEVAGLQTALDGKVSKAGDVMTGNLTLPRATTVVNALGSVTGNVTVDMDLGEMVTMTLTGPVSLTITNPPAAGFHGGITVFVTNGVVGVTWPAGTMWDGGTPPTFSTGVGVAMLTTLDGGSSWLGFIIASNMS